MTNTGPRPPSGPETGGPPSGPKVIALVEIVIATALIVAAHYATIGINPDLRAPSTVLACASLGIYALSFIARHRRAS